MTIDVARHEVIVFDQLPEPERTKRKTRIWTVTSTSGSYLGEVRWYGPWRAYCFFPYVGTIYNAGCLDDVARFCRSKTSEHMTARRVERERGRASVTTEACCDLPKTRGPNVAGQMVCPTHCSKCGHDRNREDYLDFCSVCEADGGPCAT